jgi:hypothetical protein
VVNILVNDFLDARNACYLAYSVPRTTLYLVNDAGPQAPFAGSLIYGDSRTIQNSQCTVSLASVLESGNTVTLSLEIEFASAFGGNRVIYLAARDQGQGNSGWQALGIWQVPFTPSGPISVGGATPPGGSAPPATSSSFQFTFTDQNGAGDIGIVNALINNAIDARGACYLAYLTSSNTLLLVNDGGDAGGPFAGAMPLNGTAASIENGQCVVNGGGSSAKIAGNQLTLTLNVAFKAAFSGNRVIYASGRDRVGGSNTGWQAVGTWTVK